MKSRFKLTAILVTLAVPMSAQLLNFSLRTNNQQVIDQAMAGAFVKLSQCYELCDTVSDSHYGRNGNQYFSLIPFIGIETERGLIFPSEASEPWELDKDYDRYRDQYKPLLTESKITSLNSRNSEIRSSEDVITGMPLSGYTSLRSDTVQMNKGMLIDAEPGNKEGWIIWVSSSGALESTDSVRLTSIRRDIEVPSGGGIQRVDSPEISESVCGGIYVTPVQTGIGSISFVLSGIMVQDSEGWIIDFPFVANQEVKEEELTPISVIEEKHKRNPLMKKVK